MSIQPDLTPAQQTVRDLIQAWREESGIPVSQPFCGRLSSATTAYETPAKAATSRGHDRLGKESMT